LNRTILQKSKVDLHLAAKTAKYILILVSLSYIVILFFVISNRLQYPFELEWEEGASVDHVARIVNGLRYYVKPSLDFVSSFYTPLYFFISAFVAKITGLGFFPLRLVSIVSTLGTVGVIYAFVKNETREHFPAIVSIALFAATYRLGGAWFDIGRVDMLFIFLLLFGLYFIRKSESSRDAVIAGILISLAFFTKQTAIVLSAPLFLWYLTWNKRLAVIFTGTTAVFIGLSTLILNISYSGWYNYYVFELPGTTPVDMKKFINFWLYDLKVPLSIACIISLLFFYDLLLHKKRKEFAFYFLASVGMVGGTAFARMHVGSLENVLIPSHAFIAILFGLGLHVIMKMSVGLPVTQGSVLRMFIYLICLLQFSSGALRYNPWDLIPSLSDKRAGEEFISMLSEIDGDVYVPYHGYLPVLAGKKSFAHPMGMRDVLKSSKRSPVREELLNELRRAMETRRFSAVIIDSTEPWYPPDMKKYYMKKQKIFDDENVFFPVAGMKTRPEYIFVPREPTQDG
jgi:hypothetical protein